MTTPLNRAAAAYLAEIQRLAAQRIADRQRRAAERQASLGAAIQAWLAALTPDQRKAKYTTAELASRFNVPANEIGALLLYLRFTRKRDWRGSMPYRRWWRLPDT